jgi:Mg/Co/Ni transporter MgtE
VRLIAKQVVELVWVSQQVVQRILGIAICGGIGVAVAVAVFGAMLVLAGTYLRNYSPSVALKARSNPAILSEPSRVRQFRRRVGEAHRLAVHPLS